jgi:para-aminobenzoate synthetase/4-amino-4-deoxychorismate lyase
MAPDAGGEPLRAAFGPAHKCLVAHRLDEVLPVLRQVHQAALQGLWCVGYVRYEAAPAFDPAMAVHPADGPLAWFGLQERPLEDEAVLAHAARGSTSAPWIQWPNRAEFDAHFASIQAAIEGGELYQVNATAPVLGRLDGEAFDWFHRLRRGQPGGYAAYIDDGQDQILSMSPELFFHWDSERLLTRPMKGTAPRSADAQEDAAWRESLQTSPKDRAENVMIVDLLRNDLSRLALPHTVRVPVLFDVQGWPTVWQMTSDVTAQTRPGQDLADVFTALFPCGSVTGAPKLQAMRHIRAQEPQPRGVYCGAVGVVRPGGDATFNVAIRTATVRNGRWRCGFGSGITAGSTADGEWAEWRQKQVFLDRTREPFDILETLLLRDGQARHGALHLARMEQAARHFGYPWQLQRVADALAALAAEHGSGDWRVRLLLNEHGEVRAQAFEAASAPVEVLLQLAGGPFEESHSEFTRFKTTRRGHYEAMASGAPGVFDTLLWNEAGELTECTRGNVAVQLAGQWCTPSLSCGLLGGVERQRLIEDGRLVECAITLSDLAQAQGVAFLNSLRGWLPARLVATDRA